LLLAPWLTATVRRWVRIVPPVAVTIAGVYLGYHWLTDMLAGLGLGLLIGGIVARIPWPALPESRSPAAGGINELAS
jgi:membrane-associated phospholipid phosphatase